MAAIFISHSSLDAKAADEIKSTLERLGFERILLDWNKDGLARLEQRLNAITHDLARGFSLDPGRPPYPGIHAFEAEDAAIYFGRDEETRGTFERLDARRTQGGARLLFIVGASG